MSVFDNLISKPTSSLHGHLEMPLLYLLDSLLRIVALNISLNPSSVPLLTRLFNGITGGTHLTQRLNVLCL